MSPTLPENARIVDGASAERPRPVDVLAGGERMQEVRRRLSHPAGRRRRDERTQVSGT